MNKRTIKQFGGELKFTTHIAKNIEVANRLLDEIGDDVSDMIIVPEDRVTESKRVDLVIRENDEVRWVIECQDASGWLDPIHASKVVYYCYEKKCFNCVLLTEDATEEMKEYVKFLNSETPLNIWLISPLIYDVGVDFKTIMRPPEHKNILRKKNDSSTLSYDPEWRSEIEALKSSNIQFWDKNDSNTDAVRTYDDKRVSIYAAWQVKSVKLMILRKNRSKDSISPELQKAFLERYPDGSADERRCWLHLDRYDHSEINRMAEEWDQLLEGEWKKL